MTDRETFKKARELAKAAMNRAQALADDGHPDKAASWTFLVSGWARVADLYNDQERD